MRPGELNVLLVAEVVAAPEMVENISDDRNIFRSTLYFIRFHRGVAFAPLFCMASCIVVGPTSVLSVSNNITPVPPQVVGRAGTHCIASLCHFTLSWTLARAAACGKRVAFPIMISLEVVAEAVFAVDVIGIQVTPVKCVVPFLVILLLAGLRTDIAGCADKGAVFTTTFN